MRPLIVLAGGLGVLAIYVYALAATHPRDYVDSTHVAPERLADLVPLDRLPAGFALVDQRRGYQTLRPSGRAAYHAQLFEDAFGNRIAMEIVVLGSGWARANLQAMDALCSQSWPDSECDSQYNLYHYASAEPAALVTESAAAATRESITGARVRNDTFSLAGMRITVSILSTDESLFAHAGTLVSGLERRAAEFARRSGVTQDEAAFAGLNE